MKHSRSSLFLMELIVAILFFSLASAVCMQLFAKAHTLSKKSINENHAVNEAVSLAETFLACGGDAELIAEYGETLGAKLLSSEELESLSDTADHVTPAVSSGQQDSNLRPSGLFSANDVLVISYDESWTPTDDYAAAFRATLTVSHNSDASLSIDHDSAASLAVKHDDKTSLTMGHSENASLIYADIEVTDLRKGEVLYALKVPCHVPERRASLAK